MQGGSPGGRNSRAWRRVPSRTVSARARRWPPRRAVSGLRRSADQRAKVSAVGLFASSLQRQEERRSSLLDEARPGDQVIAVQVDEGRTGLGSLGDRQRPSHSATADGCSWPSPCPGRPLSIQVFGSTVRKNAPTTAACSSLRRSRRRRGPARRSRQQFDALAEHHDLAPCRSSSPLLLVGRQGAFRFGLLPVELLNGTLVGLHVPRRGWRGDLGVDELLKNAVKR